MTLLPIVERELRVAARRGWVHWLRLGAVGGVLALWLFVWLGASGNWSPARVGQGLFNGLSLLAFIFAWFAGVFLTADAISAERREGTLGLLFLTDLRGYDIALGKLAAKSLEAGSVVLALAPMLALPLLLGGVSGASVAARAVTLALALWVSLAVGLVCSAWCGETRKALVATLTLLIALLGLPLLAGYIVDAAAVGRPGWRCSQFSPVYTFAIAESMGGPGATRWSRFALGCGWQFGFGLLCVALASWRLPRMAGEEPEVATPAPPPRRAHRRRSGGLHPFWQAGAEPGLARLALTLQVMLWAVWAGLTLLALARHDGDTFGLSLIAAYALHLVVKCQFAAESARRMALDRVSGALEALLTTPLTVREILSATRWAAWERFRRGGALALSTNLGIIFFFFLGDGFDAPSRDWLLILFVMVGAMVLLWLDSVALLWTAMRAGARGQGPLRAAFTAVASTLAPAWGAVFLYLFLGFSGLLDSDELAQTLIFFWVLGSVALDVILAREAANSLLRNLRRFAAGERVVIPWAPPPTDPAANPS